MKHNQSSLVRRRDFFQASAAWAAIGALEGAGSAPAAETPLRAARPRPPYRVWFQPRFFHRDSDLYRHMTVDASGWIDPRLLEKAGRTGLEWAYGPNHPDADGSGYWKDACGTKTRGWPRKKPAEFLSAGVALDEWVPPARPENPAWIAEGLRAGRAADPDVFIAAWCTDPTPDLIALGRENIVDLIIVEGYTHSEKAGLSTSWANAMRRMTVLADAGLGSRTIFGFGHVSAAKSHRGEYLTEAWLREHATEVKTRFPSAPGIAFFQPEDPDSPPLRDLIRAADALSGELWPDRP